MSHTLGSSRCTSCRGAEALEASHVVWINRSPIAPSRPLLGVSFRTSNANCQSLSKYYVGIGLFSMDSQPESVLAETFSIDATSDETDCLPTRAVSEQLNVLSKAERSQSLRLCSLQLSICAGKLLADEDSALQVPQFTITYHKQKRAQFGSIDNAHKTPWLRF